MPRYCAALGCVNGTKTAKNRQYVIENRITFHGFPMKDKKRLKLWVEKVGRKDFVPTPYSSLCSEHFHSEDFTFQPFTNMRLLNNTVVPSRFSHTSSKEKTKRQKTTSEFGASGTFLEVQTASKEVQTENSFADIYKLLEMIHQSTSAGYLIKFEITKTETKNGTDCSEREDKEKEDLNSCQQSYPSDASNFFKQEDLAQTHMRETSYNCDLCEANFSESQQLKIHKRVHKSQRSYNCDVCEANFSNSSRLKKHTRKHTGERPFVCEFCGVSFSESGHLIEHRRGHTGEKPYKCEICGQGFPSSGQLKPHIRTHTGERPYQCDICGKCFSHRGTLRCHKISHTGAKPYTCDICGVMASQKYKIQIHKRTHTGEKPYKCNICGKYFSHSGNLKTHKRRHT